MNFLLLSPVVVNNDDAASDSTATTNSMDVGDTFYGELDYVGDWDWIAVDLEAGQDYLVTLEGYGANGVSDTVVYVYDPTGAYLTGNDDANASTLNSAASFTASTSGTYYIAADSYSASYSGDYALTIEETEIVIEDFDVLDTISWGTEVSSNVVNCYFAPDSFSFFDSDFNETVTAESWNSYEIGQFQEAFDLIEASVDIEFNIVTSEADADFTLVMDTDLDDALGYFYPPGETNEGIGVFSGVNWDRTEGGDLELGGYGFVTIVHELLHGLGMAHPHDNGGTSSVMDGVSSPFESYGAYDLNQGIYTTMSYNSGFNTGTVGAIGDSDGEWGYEAGPMALDIALLQELYGANNDYNTGSDTYIIADANTQGTMWQSIWGRRWHR